MARASRVNDEIAERVGRGVELARFSALNRTGVDVGRGWIDGWMQRDAPNAVATGDRIACSRNKTPRVRDSGDTPGVGIPAGWAGIERPA